tara:strand:+ start:594 stop:1103 length:510 start_codon:yes stop_codon:yes gene_type:complete
MTTLLLNAETIPKLARGFVAGVNNKTKMQEAITEAMEAFIVHKNIDAKYQLEALWLALSHNKKAEAVIRSQFNTISKRVKKANGDTAPVALTVTEGVLTEVVPRASKSTGGDGDGDGEGAESAFTETAKPIDREFETHLATLNAMLVVDMDVEQRNALKYAIAQLAAKL